MRYMKNNMTFVLSVFLALGTLPSAHASNDGLDELERLKQEAHELKEIAKLLLRIEEESKKGDMLLDSGIVIDELPKVCPKKEFVKKLEEETKKEDSYYFGKYSIGAFNYLKKKCGL